MYIYIKQVLPLHQIQEKNILYLYITAQTYNQFIIPNMRKLLFIFTCMCLSLTTHAELKKVTISKATASSVESDHGGYEGPAKYAIDGNPNTFWSAQWSDCNKYPVTFTIEFAKPTHVDILRYVPRTDNVNGNWDNVKVEYATGLLATKFNTLGEYSLEGSATPYEFSLGEGGIDRIKRIRFTINSGANGYATAAEIEAFAIDNSTQELWQTYFTDPLFTELRPEIASSDGIEDPTLKQLVDNLLTNAEDYKKFRVAEYEPYRDIYSLQRELKTSATYNPWENPSGVYLMPGDECYVIVNGITSEHVGLKIKNWVKNEDGSTYSLMNGLNKITASTEGNVFVDYYTDNYKTAPHVQVHFVNAPVRGYWDQATMTNEDWKQMLAPFDAKDSTIIIVRSEHAQLAYPVCSWKQHCPDNVDSVMTLYQQVQWAERNMMGLEKYGRQTKNRQLFYASTYGFMAAGGNSAYCHVNSLRDNMTPDAKVFGFWGIGHEWGHNNQIDGFKWSGCGETTNNIYASWAELLFNQKEWCRMEDEYTGLDDYANTRGGRMQAYFEEGLRKGKPWQLQEGPDYYGTKAESLTVNNYDYDGNYIGKTVAQSRNYDHFVKLIPFWQMNLWGTVAGKCPDIIPMIIESIRQDSKYTQTYNTNGKLQMNFIKLACDSAKLNLLPFFEKAGMLKPINAYVADYGSGWNKISQQMIDNLKKYVAAKGYPDINEEINYINAYNYNVYSNKLPLIVPEQMGIGCTYAKNKVTVQHSVVRNAVAFETYNSKDSLIRITMYALNSDDAHTYTQVLYPTGSDYDEAASYIVAVGFDGTRKRIFEKVNLVKGMKPGKYYTITSLGKGNALSCGANTTITQDGTITWNMARTPKSASIDQIWTIEKEADKYYVYNPQSGLYLPGKANETITSLCTKNNASPWEIKCVDEAKDEYTFKSKAIGQYLSAHTATNTAYWGTGESDPNSRWVVEEVNSISIPIPNSGYYTACYPMPLALSEGMEAYAIGEIVNAQYEGMEYNYAILEQIQGKVIPAGMPVVLNASTGTHKLAIHTESVPATDMPNIMQGTTLKLTGIKRSSGMFDVTSSQEAGTTAMMKPAVARQDVPMNRGYILTTCLDGINKLYLQTREDLPTGINDMKTENTYSVFFDINGTRITKPQSGRVYVTSANTKVLIM